eukprot:4038157-Prymnesium_polylepis.1
MPKPTAEALQANGPGRASGVHLAFARPEISEMYRSRWRCGAVRRRWGVAWGLGKHLPSRFSLTASLDQVAFRSAVFLYRSAVVRRRLSPGVGWPGRSGVSG